MQIVRKRRIYNALMEGGRHHNRTEVRFIIVQRGIKVGIALIGEQSQPVSRILQCLRIDVHSRDNLDLAIRDIRRQKVLAPHPAEPARSHLNHAICQRFPLSSNLFPALSNPVFRDLLLIQFDSQAGAIRDGEPAVAGAERFAQEAGSFQAGGKG